MAVTYPRDWVLVDLWPLATSITTSVVSEGGDGPSTEEPIDVPAGLPILQLSNQDLGLAPFCRDGGTPSTDDALLYVALDVNALQAGRALPAWPVEPAPEAGPCGEGFYAHWQAEGTPYLAYLGLGGEAPLADRDVMFDAFESLAFEPFELAAPESTTPGYVLESLGSGDAPRNLELRQNRDGSLSLALVLPNQPEVEPILVSGFTVPGGGDIELTVTSAARMNGDGGLTDLGMIVFGVASQRVATVEIRMDDGTTVVAALIPFPASLEEPLRVFVAQPPATGPWQVVAFGGDGQVLYSESFAAFGAAASPAL